MNIKLKIIKEAQLIAQEMKKIFIKELPIIATAKGYTDGTNNT